MRKIILFLCLLLCCPCLLSSAALANEYGTELCHKYFFPYASSKPQILYTGKTKVALTMRSQPDKESASVGSLAQRETVYIYGFDQTWLFCWDDEGGAYYIGRHNVENITPVTDSTAPYGVLRNTYIAKTVGETALRAEPNTDAAVVETYPADTRLSILLIEDGWAVIPYKRLLCYIYMGDLCELEPVAPTPAYAQDGDVIAAFTTYYSCKLTELNIGRMENIRVGCRYIARSYEPEELFDFNVIAGPYRKTRGYRESPVLVGGETVAGYGGGTCQVSTTLYNALLQLPEGIEIVMRKPHGPAGATYAPHGVDAAVGAETLNLRFRNVFDFPITIDCHPYHGALSIVIRKGRCENMNIYFSDLESDYPISNAMKKKLGI